ncbi:MAG TPA: chorismate-binding protein, partial [Gemmatimonadaceae bacterium]|nr:chorismate-binding protein [Gemmatimonadaceae bacterium]
MDSSDFRSHLTHLIEEARSRAAEHGQRVLVSVSERIPSRDPLAVLDTLRRSSSSNADLECAYWTRPAENFAIAAFGAAEVLSPTGPGRFTALAKEWSALIDNAVIGGTTSTPAVGPILIGGFSFDPEGRQTQRWENFPSAHMILPRAHVTVIGGECWLSVSAVIEQNESGNANDLTALRDLILSADGSIASADVDATSDIQTLDDQPEDEWCESVDDAVKAIRSGQLRKVVLARSVSGTADSDVDAVKLLDHLRSVHRDAFAFGYWRGGDTFVGASPERLVRLDGRRLTASSLAGTIKRGDTPEHDARLARELQGSEKDLAEHAAVREMLHEVLSEFDENVESSDTPELLTLSNVHHLHTEVRATLD